MTAALLALVALALPQGEAAGKPEKIDEAVAAVTKAIAASELEKTVRALVLFQTRQVLSATDDPQRGTGAARTYLEQRLQALVETSGGRLGVAREEYQMPCRRLGQRVKVVNIVATLRGVADPDRVYVVGGHYDSINGDPTDAKGRAPGANDDGSGTAVVLELCRVMHDKPFAATILFVCYDGEEQGLLGSEAHAKALADKEVKVDGMVTNDIVGNTLGMDGKRRDGYVRCFSYSPTGNDSSSRSLARAAAHASRHVPGFAVRLVQRGDRYGRGGDHKPFYQRGYPSIRLTEPREDYSRQHQNVTEREGAPYGDLPEFMDFAYLAKVTAVNAALLAELASAPPPPRGQLVASGARDAYDTTLVWPKVDTAKGYEVVWRQTTAPDWQGALRVDRPQVERGLLTARLPDVCLDEVVVGVRSVGADGSRSRVVTPPEPEALDLRRTGRDR